MVATIAQYLRNGWVWRSLIVFIFGIAIPYNIFAATYYTATTGSDSSAGTQSSPFKTIAKGVGTLQPGDTLIIKDGVYKEQVRITKQASANSPITIKAENIGKAIMDGDGAQYHGDPYRGGFMIDDGASHIVVDGITVRNWSHPGNKYNGHGIHVSGGSNITIRNVLAANNNGTGVRIMATNTFLVANVEAHHSGFHGVSVTDSKNGKVLNTISHDNVSEGENDGFSVSTQNSFSDTIVIENCVAYNNYEQGFDVGGHDIPSSQNVTYRNIVSYNNGISTLTGGIKVAGYDSGNINVENMLSFKNGWGGFTMLAGAHGVKVNHITTYDNDVGAVIAPGGDSESEREPMRDITFTNNVIVDKGSAINVHDVGAPRTLNHNLYYYTAGDQLNRMFRYLGAEYALNQFASYQNSTGQDKQSIVAAPEFANPSNPIGPDGIWMTADDGLLLKSGPGKGNASDGGDRGYRAIQGGLSNLGPGGGGNGQTPTPTPGPTPSPAPNNGVPCHGISKPQIPTSPYALPYDPVDGSMLLSALCSGSQGTVTVGNEKETTYVWNVGYRWGGSAWETMNLLCTGKLVSGWCVGSAKATITKLVSDNSWVVGYVCQWNGTKWRCGCRDAACASQNSFWQLQVVN